MNRLFVCLKLFRLLKRQGLCVGSTQELSNRLHGQGPKTSRLGQAVCSVILVVLIRMSTSAERWLDEPLPNWMFFSSIGRQKTAHTPPLKRFLNIAPNRATRLPSIPGCCWCGHHKKVWLQHFATVKCCEDHAITLSHPGLDVASEILIWFGFSSLW